MSVVVRQAHKGIGWFFRNVGINFLMLKWLLEREESLEDQRSLHRPHTDPWKP